MLTPAERLSRPALVVVDMQNDFVRVGAPLEVTDARATIPAHRTLLDPGYTLLWEWSPQCRPLTRCCWKGHRRFYPDVGKELDCTDIIQEIYPEPDDVIIEKFWYGAFHGTPLADLLRERGVESLLITGTVTQICVEETAREAFHHNFKTTLVSDAVSSYVPDLHAATLKNFAMKFGWVESSENLLKLLK